MRTDKTGFFLCLLAVLLALCLATPARAQVPVQPPTPVTVIYYVKPTGNDTKNGLSLANAFKTIQKAVNTATSVGSIIYVAPGTYSEMINFASTVRSGTEAKPMRLVGDVTGINTSSAAGSIIIHGQGSQQYGIQFNGGNYWNFEGLTFQGQTFANVYTYVYNIKGLTFDSCTFNVAPTWGIYAMYPGDITINNNTFIRTPSTGHCAYVYQNALSKTVITNNRMNMTGSNYLACGYKNYSQNTNYNPSGSGAGGSTTTFAAYGIFVNASGAVKATMTIQNNVITDAYYGIYAYNSTTNVESTVNVNNNTAVGCYYPIYVRADNLTLASFTNNIAGDSYLCAYAYIPKGRIDSVLTYNFTYNPCGTVSLTNCQWMTAINKANIVTDKIPTFVNAASGDFTLKGTIGIDQGTLNNAPAMDINGKSRPFDGNGDGTAAYDIGAFESGLQQSPKMRVVKWKESGISD